MLNKEKKIELIKLTLTDFQGGNFCLAANGKDVAIYGDNATGKTRLVSAFTYLLFGKDSLGRKDFDIKNLDADGKAAHGLEHTVEATLSVDNEAIDLKKIYKEVWTKPKGRPTAEMSGNTTDHFINGVPKSKKEYDEKVAEIVGSEETFRLLTSPTVFPALPWQKQRSLLLEVCGDISDADVIASSSELSELPAILGRNSLEDHKKISAARKSKINSEIETLPVRIDECRRTMPDISGLIRNDIQKLIDRTETQLSEAKLKLAGVNTGGRIAELTKELAGVNADIQKIETEYYKARATEKRTLESAVSDAEAGIRSAERKIAEAETSLLSKHKRNEEIVISMDALRAQWAEVEARVWTDPVGNVCASCGQPLPTEQVETARAKALAAFNLDKAEALTEIERKGKVLAGEREEIARHVNDLMAFKCKTESELSVQKEALATHTTNLAAKIDSLTARFIVSPDLRPELEAQIKAEREGSVTDAEPITALIKSLETTLLEAKGQIDRFVSRETGEARMTELMAKEKTLAKEIEQIEKELFLCDIFIKTKVSLLTGRINSKFEFVRFKLFNELINGGIEPCCEITVNGIGYNSGLNNAGRIQAGVDIIRTLQGHYKAAPVLFVDNRESVTSLPQLSCQVISLYVSEPDKVLRVA